MEKTVNYQDRVQKKAEEIKAILDDADDSLWSPTLQALAEKAVRDEGEAYKDGARDGFIIGQADGVFDVKAHQVFLGYLKTEEHG